MAGAGATAAAATERALRVSISSAATFARALPRPTEYGPGQTTDLAPEGAGDLVARDFEDLAGALGA
jgi:hypothetical protein